MDPIFNLPKSPPESPKNIDINMYEQHPDHFYRDGNVIFIAGEVAFKLYQGVLARHSAVMGEMFASPQRIVTTSKEGTPDTSVETLTGDQDAEDLNTSMEEDGVLVINLKETAYEFSTFMDFFFPQSSGIAKHRPVGPFPNQEELLVILKVSSKYLFEECQERALLYLNYDIPFAFGDYLQSRTTRQSFKFWVDVANTPQLAHLRPIAFYEMSIMRNFLFEATPSGSSLSLEDTMRLLKGTHRIQEWLILMVHSLIPRHCRAIYYPPGGAQEQEIIPTLLAYYGVDPIRRCSDPKVSSKVCPRCTEEILQMGAGEAHVLFDRLDRHFDL